MAISSFPARRATALATILAFATGASSLRAAGAQQPAPAPLSQLQIQHDPIPCVTTTAGSAVDAQVNPGPEVSVSHVLWRAANTLPYYYYTVMTGTPPSFEGLIPRAEAKTTAVEYYVEALDRVSLSRKTPGYVAPVRLANVCAVKSVPPGKNGLGLTIGLTDPNQPPLPPGFRKEDIAKVILVTGAVVTLAVAMQMFGGASAGSSAAASGAGAGAGAGGGGISTGVLVGVGVAAAAGVAVAVANKKSNTPTPTPVVNHFVIADVTWSGTGDIDILLLGPSGQSVGTRIPVDDCSLTQSRTERVILQGASVPTGTYQVQVTGKSCGAGTPAIIATNVTAQVDGVQKCSTFVGVPVTQTVSGCSFSVP